MSRSFGTNSQLHEYESMGLKRTIVTGECVVAITRLTNNFDNDSIQDITNLGCYECRFVRCPKHNYLMFCLIARWHVTKAWIFS